ncbi:MAG: Lrp/AsnC family transcriptional regulator [Opitutales bacterium]|jgi:DNA-binding Lrp family transcriptional regulator
MADEVLKLLLEGEMLDQHQIAQILALDEDVVERELAALKQRGILLGWRPVLHPSALADGEGVHALIEVKITPEREGGFDRIAERIARFREVETCYLMSGAYDLLVLVHGKSLHSVANFVAARLSSIAGVLSTATHFMLKVYKEQGYMFERDKQDPDKPSVSA